MMKFVNISKGDETDNDGDAFGNGCDHNQEPSRGEKRKKIMEF